ncbi:MAG TPA: hypothetical protein V6C65_08050 [Allocoleopsis sp.]
MTTDQGIQRNSEPSQPNLVSRMMQSRAEAERDKRIVSWANEQYTKARTARWKSERQWYLNLSFYFGQQNVAFRGGNQPGNNALKLYTPPAPYYRSRPVINQIRPRMRTEMAKLTSQKPNAFVVPASSDDLDTYAANAGEQIWDSLYRWKKVHNVTRRAVFWSSVTGNGFIKNFWDEAKFDSTTNMQGDISFVPITPFHLFVPDLKEEEIEDQPFIIHAQIRNADQLSHIYGRPISFAKSQGDLLEESFLNIMGIQEWEKNKSVFVLECWIRPGINPDLPEGGMYVIAGNQVILKHPGWPYQHNLYPFAHIGHVETGKFYRDSVITDLIPLQREYNRTRGQIIEAKNRMAKPQLAAEIGSIDPTKVTTEPGQIILYRPGFQAPVPIPLQGLPSYVLEEQDRIKQDMDDISGQHEVSQGSTPPGVTAATAISYLQEQDDTKLSYTYDSIEEAIEKIAHMSLNYVQQYWDEPRQVKVAGIDGSFDVKAFRGSDLRQNTDIRVEAGSALPTSKAAKQAFIMDLMKMGFIDPQKGLEVMEIGGINKIYENIQADVKQAQRENLRMAQATGELIQQDRMGKIQEWLQSSEGQQAIQEGRVVPDPQGGEPTLIELDPNTQQPIPSQIPTTLIVPVNSWDDHRLHIERHNHYRKGQAFEQLPPESKALFEQHVQQHVNAIVQGAMGAMPPEMVPPDLIPQMADQEAIKETQQQFNPSVPEEKL